MLDWQRLPDPQWVLVFEAPQGLMLICEVCQVRGGPTDDAGLDAFVAQHAQHQSPAGVGLGDAAPPFLTAAGKLLGVKHCTPCERRRLLMNQAVPSLPFFKR